MKTIGPPRWAERLLEAAGANADFRDPVLGDLTEEFAIRAAYDGERDARRWYVHETFRTLPHFLRDWATSLRGGDAAYFAGVVGRSYVGVALAGGLLTLVTSGVLAALGIDLGAARFPASNGFLRHLGLPGLFTVVTLCAVFGGNVAARLGRRAPLASATALGVFWASLGLLGAVVVAAMGLPHQAPLSWTIGEPVLVIGGAMVGGVLRVLGSDDPSSSRANG